MTSDPPTRINSTSTTTIYLLINHISIYSTTQYTLNNHYFLPHSKWRPLRLATLSSSDFQNLSVFILIHIRTPPTTSLRLFRELVLPLPRRPTRTSPRTTMPASPPVPLPPRTPSVTSSMNPSTTPRLMSTRVCHHLLQLI